MQITHKAKFMKIINKVLRKLLIIIQIPLVILFIIFEELIWEGIAKPIYNHIKSMHLLQKFEQSLLNTSRGIILFFFIIIFTIVETAGVVAGILFIKGQILLGLILYLTKIPIAGFTFWLFKVTKPKLLSFNWFNWSYIKMNSLFSWFKNQKIYIQTILMVKKIKLYFSGNGKFFKRLKLLYLDIKKIFDRS